MNLYVKKLAKETGESEEIISKLWEEAKKSHCEAFDIKEEDFSSKDYTICENSVKECFKVEEKFSSPLDFINSDLSASEYLGLGKEDFTKVETIERNEDTVTSANLGSISRKDNPILASNNLKQNNEDDVVEDEDEDEDNPVNENWDPGF